MRAFSSIVFWSCQISAVSYRLSAISTDAFRFSQDSPCRYRAITLAKSEKRIAKSDSSKQMRIIGSARVDVDLFLGVPAGVPAGLYPELGKHGVRATYCVVAPVIVLGPSILPVSSPHLRAH